MKREEKPDRMNKKMEDRWRNGIHKDQHGKEWTLRDMTEDHLWRTFKMFKALDTRPLRKEIRRKRRQHFKIVMNTLRMDININVSRNEDSKRAKRARKVLRALENYP